MPRKSKKTRIPWKAITGVIFFIFLLFVFVVTVNGIRSWFLSSKYFSIKMIAYGPSLDFIQSGKLSRLKGQNIFAADLQDVQRDLQRRYPDISDLRVIRRFPDQVQIIARRRIPFARLKAGHESYVLDAQAIVLAVPSSSEDSLPLITGVDTGSINLSAGQSARSSNVKVGLSLLKAFKKEASASRLAVERINVQNLSKIYMTLSNDLDVIVDREKIVHKMKLLAFVLTRADVNLSDIKYIDLRFKEPVLGKK